MTRVTLTLATPPLRCVAPAGVFDDFAWCASDVLAWSFARDRLDRAAAITSANPPGMVFVMHAECTFLPKEKAALHVPELGYGDEDALAPWAIDDATDALWENRARPSSILSLATSRIDGLFWGLHDWAHFHNHGPFERRAWTEMQCDASALAWMWVNRAAIGIDDATWERVRREAIDVGRARFGEEGESFDPSILDAIALQRAVVTSAR